MIATYNQLGLDQVCGWFGVTRQALSKHKRQLAKQVVKQGLIIKRVNEIREDHKRMGTRKLYEKLDSFLIANKIKMGRDALFALLADYNLLVRNRRKAARTTYSNHHLKRYPNLIKNYVAIAPNRLWVSDITYWRIGEKYYYISIITDAYSRKIVGFKLSKTLDTKWSLIALKQAVADNNIAPGRLIHHSDRGGQYCSDIYTTFLLEQGCRISMTENGDPRENAIAERVNGILKTEYLKCDQVHTFQEAETLLKESVNLYNYDRPHLSINNQTPQEVHQGINKKEVKRLWKNYYAHTKQIKQLQT
jgi:transposase InsO family protein